MKSYKKIILVFASASLFCSCGQWLDIMPEDTTTEKELFSTFAGYHSAINGLYSTMAQSELYGQNLTWGFASALSQYYDNTSSSNSMAYSYTEKYEYNTDEVRNYAEQIWTTAYNVIANCNNILQHIETADPSIFPHYELGEMDIIKGEALAVRALMHFELLRLFADAPIVSTTAKAIPYSESYPDKFPARKTTGEVLEKITTDLKQASELLYEFDVVVNNLPNGAIVTNPLAFYQTGDSNGLFFSARGVRMNYVAVNALLARVYWYANDLENAYKYASEVYDYFVKTNKWFDYTTFSSGDTERTRAHKLVTEIIISSYRVTMGEDYQAVIGSTSNNNAYYLHNMDYMFQTYKQDRDDYRYTKLITSVDPTKGTHSSIKYKVAESQIAETEQALIPIMRFAELRHIMAEYLAKHDQINEAVKILNDHRAKRGCITRTLDENMSLDDFLSELDYDIWKEYIGEGQYFFNCKRQNAATIRKGGIQIQMSGKYTLPIPDSEISLN